LEEVQVFRDRAIAVRRLRGRACRVRRGTRRSPRASGRIHTPCPRGSVAAHRS
jgi:hypothetical protein